MAKLTQEIIKFIVDTKDNNTTEISYKQIADKIKAKFDTEINSQTIGRAYRAYKAKSAEEEKTAPSKPKPKKAKVKAETKQNEPKKAPKKKATANKDTITLTIQVNKSIAEQFKMIAKENDRNQSQLIREWIKKYCLENS